MKLFSRVITAGRLRAAFSSLLLIFLLTAPVRAQEIDEVVLIVDDIAVTAHEFSVLYYVQTQASRFNDVRPNLDDAATQSIIDDMLFAAHAKRLAPDVRIDDQQLAQAIEALAARNRMTGQQLLQQLQAEGVDTEIFKSALRQRLLIQEVIGKRIARSIQVSPEDVEEYIANRPELRSQVQKTYRVSHLVVSVEDGLSKREIKARRGLAEKIRAQLLAGSSFSAVAGENDEVVASGSDGDIGWSKEEDLPDLFVNALKDMQPGDISPVLESSNGFHLLALTDVKSEGGVLQQYHVRHILKALPPQADVNQAAGDLRNIKMQILAGLDFAQMASSQSNDTGSAAKGGDIGWVLPNQLDPAFAQAMQTLAPGEISDPVRSQFGLHLIQVLETRPIEGGSSLEKQVQNRIFSERLDEKMQDLLNDLKQVALIEVVSDE